MNDAVSAILDLQAAKGANAKKQVIENNKDNGEFRELLYYALHPLLTYNMSEKTIREARPLYKDIRHANIGEVCASLSSRKSVDNLTVRYVKGFLENFPKEEADIYVKLLSKTLRLGVTAKTVNKVIPGLIPEWDVQQAYPIDKYPLMPGEWFALTQKLNGVRATYYRGKLYARSGEEHKGLDHITDFLYDVAGTDMVFDGELTLLDNNGLSDNEAFRKATGIINADVGSVDKTVVCFTVFDVLPASEFDMGASKATYWSRRKDLDEVYTEMFMGSSVRVLPLEYSGTDQKMISELLDKMVREDKEGLMVNLDVPYKCKRHNGILKVKRFYTMDLPIIGCEEGSGRLEGRLGALVVDFKGNEVRVGSGFTDAERFWMWKRRDDLIGTFCEVKYKEISKDKTTGAESLQFPVFVTLRADKNEPSYG